MTSPLQELVDTLGARLQRSVAVDDTRMRLQVYSPHFGPIDDTRLDSILHRVAPAESIKHVLSLGIATANGAVRIPGHPGLGLLPRVCVPVRCQKLLLGYLWLVDVNEDLGPDDIAHAEQVAEAVGVVMYREQLLDELKRGRERELFRDLLCDEPQLREQAAHALAEGEIFTAKGEVAALVVRLLPLSQADPDERLQIAIDSALSHAVRAFPPRSALALARLDHGTVVAAAGQRQALNVVGRQVRAELAKAVGDAWQVIVGIGEAQPSLTGARTSYDQALHAIRVGEVAPGFDDVVSWSQLGVYSILTRLSVHDLTTEVLHPGLVRLLDAERGEDLVETLETYLDRAGDVKSTAAELLIHRTSLYYRLSKIEQIAGVSLSDGGDRLSLHLGLKLARLVGAHGKPRPTVSRQRQPPCSESGRAGHQPPGATTTSGAGRRGS